jgi:hypothetical protein
MRNISAEALAQISKTDNVEPVILIKIFWNNGNGITYSDRKFETYGFEGKVLSVGPIDDVISVQGSSTSAEVQIMLSDTDGTLKQIFNTSDIHKTRVQILQWFTGIPISDAFVIFDGQINSPIEWKESDRTLLFNVMTAIEDVEVGVSIEETTFNLMPESLIGKAWPVVFGSVGGVLPLVIQEPPSAVIARGVGVVNEPVWDKELSDLEAARDKALANWTLMFQASVGAAIEAASYKSDFPPFTYLDLDRADQLDQAAQNGFNQAAAYYAESVNIANEIAVKREEYNKQKRFSPNFFTIVTNNLPVNTQLSFKAGDMTLIGVYNGDTFQVISKQFPKLKNDKPRFNNFGPILAESIAKRIALRYEAKNSQLPGGSKFYWLEAGTQLKVTNFPVNYIASLGHVNVLQVYGRQNGVRTIVPNYYYQVRYETYPNTIIGKPDLQVTYIYFSVPLTSRVITDNNAKKDITWDSDQIEVDCIGTIGPNVIDIMIWAINNFTVYSYDATSFNYVKTKLANYPCNFALTNKKSVTSFLMDLAFQSRCAVWLNDNKFYIRYLAERPTPIDTITDDDILVETMSVTTTPTEDLVTKLVAYWKARYSQQESNRIIFKYNTLKYGVFTLDYDFYAFNIRQLVEKSTEFWIIRKSNTFKILKFKTALNKLRLENFDPVTIDLTDNLVANGPVLGIVQKASYNSDDNTIDFEIWIPVRLGEMEEYQFAHPAGLTIDYRYPVEADPNLVTGSPYESIAGSLPNPETFQAGTFNVFVDRLHGFAPIFGRDQSIGDSVDTYPTQVPQVTTEVKPIITVTGAGGFSVPEEENYGIPLEPDPLEDANQYVSYTVEDAEGISIPDPVPATFPGQIVSGSGLDYRVKIYTKGLSNSTSIVTVKQLNIKDDEIIPVNTWVMVTRNVWKVEDELNVEYTMQTPIWLKRT